MMKWPKSVWVQYMDTFKDVRAGWAYPAQFDNDGNIHFTNDAEEEVDADSVSRNYIVYSRKETKNG